MLITVWGYEIYTTTTTRYESLLDELLAVSESGLARLPSAKIELVALGLKCLDHMPVSHHHAQKRLKRHAHINLGRR